MCQRALHSRLSETLCECASPHMCYETQSLETKDGDLSLHLILLNFNPVINEGLSKNRNIALQEMLYKRFLIGSAEQ